MLDSDISNPNYVGALNPDRMIHVVFKDVPARSEAKSQEAGKPVFDTVTICLQTPPGGLISVPEIANEGHKQRFPFQWQAYLNTKGQGQLVNGTPLDEWPALDVGMRETLRAQKFYTVEQIAEASDSQLQVIGMAGRMLQDKAKAYLMAAKDTAAAQKLAAEVKRRDEELAELRAQVQALLQKEDKRK